MNPSVRHITNIMWPRFIGIQSNTEQLVTNFPAYQAMRKLQKEYETDRELGEIDSMCEPVRLNMKDGIECRDLNYRYDSNEPIFALNDINIHIPANRMTAIVGKSGAGKSTLIDMFDSSGEWASAD